MQCIETISMQFRYEGITFTGFILIALVLACGCTGYSTPPGPEVPGTTPVPAASTVAIQNFAFVPTTLQIAQYTTVTWTNLDTAAHQVESDQTGQTGIVFGSLPLEQGGTYSYTFTKAGTYSYHCRIHPSMTGSIIVV